MPNFADNKNNIKCDVNGENANEEELTDDFKHYVSKRVKLYEANMKGSASSAHLRNHKNNNNNNIRHVVPVGILIVLFTLYLATAAFQSNYTNRKQENGTHKDASTALKEQELQALEAVKRLKLLEKLLEYKDLCTELEVFTKDLRWINGMYDEEDTLKKSAAEREQAAADGERDSGVEEIASNAGEDRKSVRRNGQSGVAIKNNKVNNENSKNNNSNDNINHINNINNNIKKVQPIAKKTNTAEPIIYLFALVFIYLLLKAASDINQHYKSQNKGDKRLRRCSLQSYAQTHKQDRRASKGSPNKKLNRELFLETRSKSVDRFSANTVKKSEILANIRKYTSFDEHSHLAKMHCGVYGLPQLAACEAQGTREIVINRKESNAPKVTNRRGSVPNSLNFQRQKISAMPALPISHITRRTSLSGLLIGTEAHLGGLQFAEHGQDAPQFHEVKRRVRMINRH